MTITDVFTSTKGMIPEWRLQDRLRLAREQHGWTQGDLANLMNSNYKVIGNVERGTTPISGPMLIAWAAVCGVDYDWLKDGTKPPTWPQGPDGGLTLPGLDSNQEPIGANTHSNLLPFRTRGNSERSYKKAA